MKIRRILLLLSTVQLLFLSGCANIFIADDTVLTISDTNTQTAKINSLITEQPGLVSCFSQDHNTILSISSSNNLYSIDNYSILDNSLVNIINSDTRIFDIQAAKGGFFYSRINPSDSANIQISWSTYDKSIERTITDSLDNASEIIYAYGEDSVVYINNNNSLVFSNSNGSKTKYDLNVEVEVSQLVWSSKEDVGFMIAREGSSENYRLYHLLLEDDKLAVNPIANNVIDMNFSKKEDKLVYIIQSQQNVECYELSNITTINNKRLFGSDDITKISYSYDDNSIYYLKNFDNSLRSVIWYFNIETKEHLQLTSPMRLISDILPISNNEIVFSVSQLTYLEASDIIQTNYYITQLDYDLPIE